MNPVVDLARSFNFFNPADRYTSAFKIRSLSLKAVHHLHDWDLSFEYTGAPKLVTYPGEAVRVEPDVQRSSSSGSRCRELKAAVSGDRDGVYLRQ